MVLGTARDLTLDLLSLGVLFYAFSCVFDKVSKNKKPARTQYRRAFARIFVNVRFAAKFTQQREGFEPSKRLSPFTHFPGVRLQPLGHLSKKSAGECAVKLRGSKILMAGIK
jgi:hypothetical protein